MIFALALATAAGPAAAATLDLETATRLAVERSNDAADAELAVARQTIALRAARLAWTPDLSARAGGQGSLGRTFSEQLGTNVTEPIASLSGSVSASMPLYQGGALAAERRGARASLDAAESDQAQTRLDLQWTAIDKLLQVGQARAALEVQQAALEADQALLAQVDAQVDAGTRTPADRYAQQAVVASRHAAIASAAQALAETELTLLALLRLDPADDWSFAPPQSGPSLGVDAEALTATAFVSRPDLSAAEARVEAAVSSKRAADGAFLPSVSLGAGLSSSWLSTREDPFSTQLGDQARSWVSLDVSVPLWDRGVRRSRSDTAAVAVREAELARQRLQDAVRLDVQRLLAAEAAAVTGVEASAAGEDAARRAVEVLQLRYEAGAETLVAVTAARADLVDAALARSRAQAALQRVRYQLAWTVGQLG